MLNVMDDVTRECLAAVVDTSISGKRVARELAQLVVVHGKLGVIVSDNGTELTSNAVLSWAGEAGIDWHYIAPGGVAQGSCGAAAGMATEGSRPRTAPSKASTDACGTSS